MIFPEKKIGILGGGQLGKMLCIAAAPWHLKIAVLDKDPSFPAAPYCTEFVKGDFSEYDDVMNFGKDLDIITIEIEGVNSKALHDLKKMGKAVFPDPEFLDIVKDKGRQNQFYRVHRLPTTRFSSFDQLTELKEKVDNGDWKFPFVWKSRFEGYDGRGVAIVKSDDELNSLPKGACLIEELVDIEKELAIIVCRNENGEKSVYGAVEMVFHEANLLDQLESPANIDPAIEHKMKEIAFELVDSVDYRGILAIEFFLDKKGNLLINEVAPRPHNSGHHTIECCPCSQYEQLIRMILNLPPGDTTSIQQGIMFNLLGHPDYSGQAKIEGFQQALNTKNVHLHWYGKPQTRPMRKMGHVVVAGENRKEILSTAEDLKKKIIIKS